MKEPKSYKGLTVIISSNPFYFTDKETEAQRVALLGNKYLKFFTLLQYTFIPISLDILSFTKQ